MIALRWLYEQAVRAGRVSEDRPWWPDDGGVTHCWLCACACPNTAPSQPVKGVVRDTFTDHDLARYHISEWVCPACSWYLDRAGARADNWITKAWLITPTTATEWERADWRSRFDAALYA
ncbi:MAG TPA: hypothetical protein VMV29_08865, partial [Ktedonobacterales bacterium]|nr:hypothetical protein [Ktedonobacterales bacterium]